jgi:hypothetical protein
MSEPDFISLEQRLVREGVLPGIARRLTLELAEHYDDLRAGAESQGLNSAAAARIAQRGIGTNEDIASSVLCRRELKVWIYHYPRIAGLLLPATFVALLPLAPLFAGVTHAGVIARWTACLVLSATFTAVLMLMLQMSLALR